MFSNKFDQNNDHPTLLVSESKAQQNVTKHKEQVQTSESPKSMQCYEVNHAVAYSHYDIIKIIVGMYFCFTVLHVTKILITTAKKIQNIQAPPPPQRSNRICKHSSNTQAAMVNWNHKNK